MALNLSTLTNPATSGTVLAEALTTADLLDSVPILKNLARGSNKGGDAKQTTALNQPRALPLIKNPSGNLGGYLYIPDVSGNYATGPSVTIGANQTWQGELDMVITQWGSHLTPMGGGYWSNGFGLVFYTSGAVRLFSKASGAATVSSGVTLGTPFNVKYGFDGSAIYVDIDGARVYSDSSSGIVSLQSGSITHTLELNQQANIGNVGNYAIQKAKLTVNSAVVFDCDFNGSTSIRHGDTKFQASVGGPVTINQSGNDPATVIKKPVLRFDGSDDGLQGLFNQTITEGYMFAAFSVLGSGGDSSGRVFSINSTGQFDSDSSGSGAIFSIHQTLTTDLRTYVNNGYRTIHPALFDDANGDILHESLIKDGTQLSRVNNADQSPNGVATSLSAEEFSVASRGNLTANTAIDLEYLALFDASLTTEQANKVRSFINKRNSVFYRWDTDGYYFFDPQKASFTGNFTGSNTLDGYITGSDLGDTDVRSNLTLEQSTLNDQPSTDGYTITFNDSAEHLEFENAASQNLTGWQICGTSLGTFAYRVNANAVTELNLLGNLGGASFRQAGQSYGMILLPESATGADIEAARKLLIDRGASDAANTTTFENYWRDRGDIVEFQFIDTSTVTDFRFAFFNTRLTSFPPIDTSNGTNFFYAFYDTRLTSFPALDMSKGENFSNAWNSVSTLTSFPADAKLGTSASNVNFSSAWRQTGLTSFSTPLPTATNVSSGWYQVYSLTDFSVDSLPEVQAADAAWYASQISSFNTSFPKVKSLINAWNSCSSLTDFSANVFADWNPSSISSGIFHQAWLNCSLTAQSVENILTSIDASNQHGTDDGTSTGNPLGDSGIDIDYNVATGSLSAATNTAVTSLKSKGWSIIVNNVTL